MTMVLDWLLAFLPILAVLVLMLRFRWGGAKAGAVGWVVALLVAGLHFSAGWEVLAYAQLKGLLLTLFVAYIIWGALLFFRVTDEAGAVRAVGAGLPRLTPDRGLQALLLGWVFSTFLQGVGGFGVPVAVVAPLLVGLGFPPAAAIVIPSVGHPWAVTFGSLGSSFLALMGATDRAGEELAPWCAVLLGLACLACGAATLWAAGGRRTLLRGLVPLLVVGLTMAGVQYLVATSGLWTIGAMMAGLAGLAVGVGWARWRAGRRRAAEAVEERPVDGMPIGWALAPYALLIVIVLLVALIPAVSDFLGQVVLRVEFPELVTGRGWVTPAGVGRTVDVFGHAGAQLVYASLLAYLLFRWRGYYTPGAAWRIARGVAGRAARSTLGTAAMVGMAATMEHAGMTYLLADGIARVAGQAFPLVSPFIGALGAFMTGSNTNSNVVFADLQQSVAVLVGASPLIMLAAQTAGGAIGSAFAPAKIIVGCSTVEAEEGPVLWTVMRYGLLIVAGLAVATLVAVYGVTSFATDGSVITPPTAGYVYFSRDQAIWKFDVLGGQEAPLLNRRITQRMSISPDGRWLSYYVFEEAAQESLQSIWVVDTRTGGEKKASSTARAVAGIWLPDNRLMVVEWPDWYLSDDGNTLVKGHAYYGVFDPATGRSDPASWYIPSPDNVMILYAPTFDCAAERPYPHLGTDTLRVFCVGESEPITIAKLDSLVDIAWSADGRSIVFQSQGTIYIWQREVDELQEIDLDRRFATALSWSPDGQWLAFQDGQDQCVLHFKDKEVTCFGSYLSGTGTPLAASWSLDSQKIVFATCSPVVCEQTGGDCATSSLITLSVPEGEIAELATGVDFSIAPVWGR